VTGWQVTAATIYCDAVDDDVTIMVYKNGSTKCSGFKKYGEFIDKQTAGVLKGKARRLGSNLECEGPLDYRVTDYRDKLMAEDKAAPVPAKPTKKKRT